MKKQITLSLINLILVFLGFCTLTFAWFTMDEKNDVSNMDVSIEEVSDLVIAKTVDELRSYTSNSKTFKLDFNNNYSDMIACTHDNSSKTLLKYVKNTYDLNKSTGLVKDGKTLTYNEVPSDNTKYYYDVVVYIACLKEQLNSKSLVAYLINNNSNLVYYLKCASIDFYVGEDVNSSNYKGTLNLAGVNSNNDFTSITSLTLSNDIIPLNTSSEIKVTMRCYFDGALLKDSNNTYVTSENLDTNSVSLQVYFEVKDN